MQNVEPEIIYNLKAQLTVLIAKKENLDAEICKLQQQIELLSNNQTKGKIKK